MATHVDPRTAFALPARTPQIGGHSPAPWASWPVPPVHAEPASGSTIFMPDESVARRRARLMAQLSVGSRRTRARRAAGGSLCRRRAAVVTGPQPEVGDLVRTPGGLERVVTDIRRGRVVLRLRYGYREDPPVPAATVTVLARRGEWS